VNVVSQKDRDRKNRAKIDQYSSAAFISVAKREGWNVPAKPALDAALLLANKLTNNRKPRAELRRALVHLEQLENTQRVPRGKKSGRIKKSRKKEAGPFARLLSDSLKEKGVTAAALAKTVGIPYRMLWRWVTGEREPADEAETIVDKIEVQLGLEANQLWKTRRPTNEVCWPAGFPACPKLRRRIAKQHVGLGKLPPKEQEAIIWNAHNPPPKKPKDGMKTLGMDLSKWPARLGAGLRTMLEIKRNRTEPLLGQ
jgi:hypothetical protein